MPNHFSSLSEMADRQAIRKAVRDIIKDLHYEQRYTYKTISNSVSDVLSRDLDESAIKVFLESNTDRTNLNNRALPLLYDYIRSAHHTFPLPTRHIVTSYWAVLVPDEKGNEFTDNKIEHSLGLILKAWLKITDHEISKLSTKMFDSFSGNYVLLRKSVHDPNMVVRSMLKIERTNGNNGSGIPRVHHYHHDRHGAKRTSTGLFLPLSTNVYAIMEIEDGEGLEILALRNPIQHNFIKMMGFLISMNMDRNILSARVFIERDNEHWQGIKPRFTVDEVRDRRYVFERLCLLDENTSLTIPNHQIEEDSDQ